MAEQNLQQKQWAKIVAKAWADEGYKNRLLTETMAVLKEEGLELPAGVDFKCLEATETQAYLVLPPKPDDVDNVTDGEERLAAFSAGCSPINCHIIGCY